MGALTDRYKAILKKQAWHKRLMEWHKDSHPLTKNEDGTPKVFYHGTGADFDTFKVGETGAIWVTSDINIANKFSAGALRGSNKNPNTMAIYVKTKNPFILGDTVDEVMIQDWFSSLPSWMKEKTKEKIWENRYNKFNDFIFMAGILSDKAKNILKKYDYDSVLVGINIAILNPNQIKSIHNKGTFDENSAVITDSVTLDMSPANKISKAKKNAHMVASGHKDFKQVGKDKDGNILIFEKGNTWVIRGEIRGYGLDKIVAKHILHQKDLTYEDIVNSPEIKKHSEEYIAKNGNTVFDFPSKANPIFKIVFGTATDNKRNKRLLKNGSEFKTLKSMYQMSANGRLSPIIPNPEFDSVSVSLSSEFSELNTHDTIIPKNTNQVNMVY